MNWNLFWEIYVFAFALACWSCFYLLVVRKRKKGERCTAHTMGQVNTPWESSAAEIETNLTTRENLPLHLKVRIRKNSFVNIQKSPLFQLYPVGSEADIFYNPEKPKEAFVQRYEGVSRWLGILLAGVAVLLTIIGLCMVFEPEIVMSSGTF